MMAGIFITFEGPDGAGKTTQLNLLAENLRQRGLTVCCTREPGGTELGDKIRNLLLDIAHNKMSARTEALLYMAARAQHVAELILPVLARGEVVLSDRYADSTIVYQGVARCLAKDELVAINRFATEGVKPDLTLLLDGDVGVFRSRLARRGRQDRMEQEGLNFHESVRQGFLELATAEPERIRIVNNTGTVEAVHQAVVAVVAEFLNRRSNNEG
jgi:dTMP kinase